MARAARSVLGVSALSVRFGELESHITGADLGVLPDVVIGGLLFITALGPVTGGPIALEIATNRKLDLPEGPHPALGIPIVQIEGPR